MKSIDIQYFICLLIELCVFWCKFSVRYISLHFPNLVYLHSFLYWLSDIYIFCVWMYGISLNINL